VVVNLRLQAKLARRTMRRFSQMTRYRRISLDELPILFANSFPKSGTHLLTQVLQGFIQLGPVVDSGLPAIVTYDGPTGKPRSTESILGDLQRLLPGDIAYGHLHASAEIVAYLCQDGFIPYFILRDPRDVVVSHVHYVTDMAPNHVHHHYYKEELHNFDERLRTSILGRPDIEVPFPDILGRFQPYMGWLDQPRVLMLRFEDFITQREETIGRVLNHAIQGGFPLSCDRNEAVGILADSIDPQRSPTFRSGKVGGWRAQFDPEHKKLFKEIAGDLLIRLGYEQDNDW
jgi:sulfotransferase 6B1